MKSFYPSPKLVKVICKLVAKMGIFLIFELLIDFASSKVFSKGTKIKIEFFVLEKGVFLV